MTVVVCYVERKEDLLSLFLLLLFDFTSSSLCFAVVVASSHHIPEHTTSHLNARRSCQNGFYSSTNAIFITISPKMHTTTALLSALPILASAANIYDQTFTLLSARSASPIHLQPINASAGGLWIGKPQTTFCPNATAQGTPIPCPNATYSTIFTGPDEETGGIALDVDVPGGQMM